jgi:hydrogenase maturation protein HypF
VEGERNRLDDFVQQLRTRSPSLARIARIDWHALEPRGAGAGAFSILESVEDAGAAVCISPDVATCADCLAELLDPTDRRWRYPFINCTNCGPRLTIIKGAPYDRALTTMAAFAMCDACRREYENPRDRRFHAQPVACAACGPSLQVRDSGGEILNGDPLATAEKALRDGRIVAVKGLGGFHLACDAANESAVRELRRRKHRDEKPFAVMLRDLAAVEECCNVTAEERALLESPRRPIVLLRRRRDCTLPAALAPANPYLGIMLPYTPLHHLMLSDLGDMGLVMTSGNRSDEPIAYQDDDALQRLRGIADLFLTHNRPIHVRCDDSVTQLCGGRESPIRRSRGYAPQPIPLPVSCPQPMLAVGGQLKSTFALGRDNEAILSHHLGDLDHLDAYRAFERDIHLYEQSFAMTPRVIVRDLHPDYASSHYALRRAEADGIPCVAVQHHHAHIASCMAEHGLDEPVIGVSFDGTGYGSDGAVWGGEFLIGDLLEFRRAAHLRYVRMPGGERAIKEPWRMAVAHLLDAGVDLPASMRQRLNDASLRTVQQLLARQFNAPPTSSVGRLFDAVASLAGICDSVSFEGQAAMRLQWLAMEQDSVGTYPFLLHSADSCTQIDTRPLIRAVAEDVRNSLSAAVIAARFHQAICDIIVAVCARLREQNGINRVVLSGGVFMNSLLAERVQGALEVREFLTFRHCAVGPNDGSLSLGQLAIAARKLATRAIHRRP